MGDPHSQVFLSLVLSPAGGSLEILRGGRVLKTEFFLKESKPKLEFPEGRRRRGGGGGGEYGYFLEQRNWEYACICYGIYLWLQFFLTSFTIKN